MKKIFLLIIILYWCTELCYGLRPYSYFSDPNNIKDKFVVELSKLIKESRQLDTWMERSEAYIDTLKGNEGFIAWVMVRHLILDNISGLSQDLEDLHSFVLQGNLDGVLLKIKFIDERISGFTPKLSNYLKTYEDDEVLSENMLLNLVYYSSVQRLRSQVTADFLESLRSKIKEVIGIIQTNYPLDKKWESIIADFRSYASDL